MTEIQKHAGYRIEQRCKVCSAVDTDGKPLREQVDALVLQGGTYEEAANILRQNGMQANTDNIASHIKKHSPYVQRAKQIGSKTGRMIRVHAELKTAQAEDSLQKIIDMGSQMVQNWWEGKEGEKQLPVTERLYIEALKEQGKRGKTTILDAMLVQMDQELIDSEQNNANNNQITS